MSTVYPMLISRRTLLVSVPVVSVLPACDGIAMTGGKPRGEVERSVTVESFLRHDDPCDGAAINLAIERIHAQGGGIVQLASRTYNTSQPITLRSRVTLRGNGTSHSRIKQIGAVEAWSSSPLPGIITTRHDGAFEDIHIQDLSLEGRYKTAIASNGPHYAKSGIAILNARHSSIQRCAVSDVGTGVGFFGRAGTGPHRNLISDCTVRNANSWVEPGNSGTPRGITMATDFSTVRNCSVIDSHTGYYVATEHGVYENCAASGWQDDGFYINANYCRLENCRAVAADKRNKGLGSGFAVNPSKGNLFRSCWALRCPNAGMRFRHAGDIAPNNNYIVDCTFIDCGYGFLDDMTGTNEYPAALSRGNEFIGNVAKHCQLSGFMFIRQSDGIFRQNRAISNNRGGITLQNRGGISFAEYCVNNIIEDNVCDDPETVKTQKWGLYIYPVTITKASIANTANRIHHHSRYGIDVM